MIRYWYNRLFTNKIMLWSEPLQQWERGPGLGYTNNVYEAGWFERETVGRWYVHSMEYHRDPEIRRK